MPPPLRLQRRQQQEQKKKKKKKRRKNKRPQQSSTTNHQPPLLRRRHWQQRSSAFSRGGLRKLGRRAKIDRGVSRHRTLQKALMARAASSEGFQNMYVTSLGNTLSRLIQNYDQSLKVYAEVPFPSGDKKRKSSRVDALVYEPGRHFITVEYKTTETDGTDRSLYESYLEQVERSIVNIMKTVNYASSRRLYTKCDGRSGPLFISLLTVRNFQKGPGSYSDYTVQIGEPVPLPNLNYNMIINRLYNKALFC